MSRRNRREHGRILSVETKNRGDSLAEDFAAGVTSITVNDAGDFDEDGGWLYIGAQVVEYTDCDDDTGVITLVDPLTAAAEQGDPVSLWSDLYGEVVDYQLALVELDGEYDNPDPVVAEVAEGVGELPEGDRGKAGESCTLKRVSEDEWEVVGVGGRSRKSQAIRFEQDDTYTLTAADIAAGTATMPLSHRPKDEALTCYLAGVPQRPTEWSIDYDAQTLTIPLDGWEQAGMALWVHYAYRTGITTVPATTLVERGVWFTPTAIREDRIEAGWEYWVVDFDAPSVNVATVTVYALTFFTDNSSTSGQWNLAPGALSLEIRNAYPAKTVAGVQLYRMKPGTSNFDLDPYPWSVSQTLPPPSGAKAVTIPSQSAFWFGPKLWDDPGTDDDEPWGPLA